VSHEQLDAAHIGARLQKMCGEGMTQRVRRDGHEGLCLLAPLARTDSGYRQYDEADVHTLKFIKRGRELVFSMIEIAYFSDRGRLFQTDRGRCFSAIVDAQGCAQARN
jgi:hypothetical protein